MKKVFFKKISTIMLIFISQFASAKCENCCEPSKMNDYMYFISLAPIVLFILLIILIFWKLQLENYKIGDSLKENDTINVSIPNPAYTAPNNSSPSKPVLDGSTPSTSPAIHSDDLTTTASATIPLANAPTPFVGKTIQPQSTSRLIAFISGMITMGLTSCLTSFWLFRYFECNVVPDLTSVTYVLLSLGLGVVPYAVNKITTPSRP